MPISLNALTTVDAVKEYLKIDSTVTVDDLRIEGLINACSTAIENYCRRTFALTTYTDEEYDGTNSRYLTLLNYPVESVTNVNLNGQDLGPSEYTVRKRTGVLVRVAPYPNTFTGLSISRFNAMWSRGDLNVLVTYTAGLDTIPDDVELACKMYVSSIFKADIASFSTTFTDGFAFKADSMPVQVKLLLQPYVDTAGGVN